MNWLRAFKNSSEPTLQEEAIGLAIHEDRFNWIVFKREEGTVRVASHGSSPLESGIIEEGEVKDTSALAHALSVVKDIVGDQAVHVSFPPNNTFIFTMHIPLNIPLDQVRNMITFELETRLPGKRFDDMVIQYESLAEDAYGQELAIVVYPHTIEETYEKAFAQAGIRMASIEPSMRSVVRALFNGHEDDSLHAVADVGSKETNLYVVRNGIPVVLSHIPHGEARVQGIAEDAVRRLRQWDSRKDSHDARITPIGRVHIVGSHAHHPSYVDLGSHVGKGMRVAINHGNVWNRVFSFDDYIPPIDRVSSAEYAAAIGLALRGLLNE